MSTNGSKPKSTDKSGLQPMVAEGSLLVPLETWSSLFSESMTGKTITGGRFSGASDLIIKYLEKVTL